MSTSPTKVWVRVTSTDTALSGALWPETAKLITSGAPYAGGVKLVPSGIAPTPVPGKLAGVHPGVPVGVAVAVAVAVGVAVPVAVAVGVAVAVPVAVAVGVAVGGGAALMPRIWKI